MRRLEKMKRGNPRAPNIWKVEVSIAFSALYPGPHESDKVQPI